MIANPTDPGAERARIIKIAQTLLAQVNVANGFTNDFEGRIYTRRHVRDEQEEADTNGYPLAVILVNGTGWEELSHISFDVQLLLTVIAYAWVPSQILPADEEDIASKLWADILKAINPVTSCGRFYPDSTIDMEPERGLNTLSVSVDYIVKFNACFEVQPPWLTENLIQQMLSS